MSLIVQINEIVSGPIKNLFLQISGSGPLISFPQLPPVNIQIGPEVVGDIPLGSSCGDADLGSSFGDANLGSTVGSAPTFGSSNGDRVLGSSGLTLPVIPNIPGLGS